MPNDDDWGPGDRYPSSSSRPTPLHKGHLGWRQPSLDDTTYLFILLIVLVPVIFTVILCTITYCIYRYNRRRSNRNPTDSRIVSFDQSGPPLATVIYNPRHHPYIFEDSPPAYDSLGQIKKDTHNTINSNEQYPLTVMSNSNEGVTVAAALPILPTAPTPPPPPSYVNLNESNK